MYNTLSDWMHDFQHYYSVNWKEMSGWAVTSFFAAFIFTFNDWGIDEFDPQTGLTSLVTMAVFLFIVFAVTCLILKIPAMRLGYKMHYQPHLLGLMAGLVIAVASAGFLPIFIPGGFEYDKNVRKYIGHWRGFYRPWEIAMLASAFPMLLLFWALFMNRLFLRTGNALFESFVIALCLTSIYCLLPLPNVALEYGGRVLDFFRYLKGMTFGLDIYMNSRVWFVLVSIYVILVGVLTWILTSMEVRVNIFFWLLAMIVAFLGLWAYKELWEDQGPYYRH